MCCWFFVRYTKLLHKLVNFIFYFSAVKLFVTFLRLSEGKDRFNDRRQVNDKLNDLSLPYKR